MTPGARAVPIVRVADGAPEAVEDRVAVEEPLEIRLRWGDADAPRVLRLAVTMRTPGHDAALALGFLAGEGVIAGPEDVIDVAHTPLQGGHR
ncbi:MAG: formate dehydrogenase accessory sulfurtransferase FdhD, partial [Bacteroidota bacterium]